MPFKSKTDGQIRRRNRMQEGRPAETDRPSPSKRGYGWDWQKVRAAKLARNPLCERCEQRGKVVEATVVHHKEILRGDTAQVADGLIHSRVFVSLPMQGTRAIRDRDSSNEANESKGRLKYVEASVQGL